MVQTAALASNTVTASEFKLHKQHKCLCLYCIIQLEKIETALRKSRNNVKWESKHKKIEQLN
jgi:hypothetical protein